MQRRSYLAALGGSMAGLAGCQSFSGDPTDGPPAAGTETGTREPTPTETPTDEHPEYTTIVDLETVSRTYALSFPGYREDEFQVTVEFVATATPKHPVTVRATLRNDADYESTARLRSLPPFDDGVSRTPREPGASRDITTATDANLVFAPTAGHDLVADPPTVERDEDGIWRVADVAPWLPDTVRLSPGETVEGEYHLVGHPSSAGGGRPTGVYEFAGGDSRDLLIAVWHTERPGPERESRFAGHWVPPLPGEGTVAWFHEADASTASYVEPSVERTQLPAAVSFTFVNHAREPTSCGHWNVYKLADGEWYDLGPVMHFRTCPLVTPGGATRATLRAFPGEGLDCGDCDCGQELTFEHLGGGRYAVVAGYGHATDRSAAMVALDAPPTEVTPTGDVRSERDGATVTVTSEQYGDGDEDGWPEDATYETTRIDSADARLVAEQVMQRRYLRNSLPFFGDGVERVVLRTTEGVVAQIGGIDRDGGRFRFRGDAYEVRRTDED